MHRMEENMKINKELIKGSTDMLILNLLKNEDMYGYQMIKKLKEKSKNVFELKEGTLYPILHSLEEKDVYISTRSACSTGNASKPVLALTNDEEKAKTSVRISISKKTTKLDIENFLKAFDESYRKLM